MKSYEPIDWKLITTQIREKQHGKGLQALLRNLGIDMTNFNELARGNRVREPRYTTGVRLLRLHSQLTREV